MTQRLNTARRANTASISITGWPDQVEPEQLVKIFEEWGISLDLGLVNFEWFFSTEVEGYTLRVQMADMVKARELLELRDKQDFEFGIGEITAAQQSRLRLIATSPKEDAATSRARYPKPNTQSILSATQLAEIRRCVSNPLTGGQQPKEVEVTILGKIVPPPSPKTSPKATQDVWETAEGRNTKKTRADQSKKGSTQKGKVQENNAYAALEEHEKEEMEEEENTDKEQEQDEKEERKVGGDEKINSKGTGASAAKAARTLSQKKLAELKKKLTGHKLWGKETSLIVETYIEKMLVLGVDVANDALENLLGNTTQEIKRVIDEGVSGEQPSNQNNNEQVEDGKRVSSEDRSHIREENGFEEGTTEESKEQETMETSQDSQTQEEETKDAEEEKTLQTSNPRINPISKDGPDAGAVQTQGEGSVAFTTPYQDPPSTVPLEVHKEQLPDKEAAGTSPATFNLSSNGIPKNTITGYFPRTEKSANNPIPPSLSQ
jgi:hypothetical protein